MLDALSGHDVPDVVRQAVEDGLVGAVIADARRILDANDHYLALIGATRAELDAGTISWLRLTPPEWLAADARAIGEATANGRAAPYAKEYAWPDGERVAIRLSLLTLSDEPLRLFALIARTDDEQGMRAVEAFA